MNLDADKAYTQKEGVYEHLGKIVGRVVAEKPKDAYGLIEVLSRFIKEPSKAAEVTDDEAAEELKVLTEKVQKGRTLDKVPTGEDGAEPLTVPCTVPDFVEDAEMFSWAGAGLGAIESYKVMCSMRNMAVKLEGVTKLRFWGKVLGTDADYYVAEASAEGGEADSEDMDPPGEGANQFTYFVAPDLAGAWVKLPHVKPADIVAARQIKYLFTGNPQAKVTTHPFFEGKEEVLLRAQIARITADTLLCAKGALKRDDPDDPSSAIVPDTEFLMPPAAQLCTADAWMHMTPHLLDNGRTRHKELPDKDEEPEAYAAAVEEQENDPPKDVLRGLGEDGLMWSVKQAGDTMVYTSTTDGKPKSNAVTYARCLTWPGATFVAQGANYANLYIGYGVRAGAPDFFPPAPPCVQDEPEDPGEVPEPQGTEEEPAEAEEA